MAAFALVSAQVLLGANDLSPFTGGFQTAAETQMKEANNFAALGYTVMLPGITTATASLTGHCDYATGAVNAVFNGTQKGSQQALSILPLTGPTAVSTAGDPAIFTRGLLSKLAMLTGKVGDVADFTMDLTGDSAEIDGVVGFPLASRGNATGTAVQIKAVSATQRLWAAVHVTAGTFTNLIVTIQSDTVGFPSPTTVITFATVSAPGWQFLSVAGPITDDYFRVVTAVSSGTATCAVVMGVQ